MTLANLTGHEINLCDRFGEVVKVIPPCEYEEPIRATVGTRRWKIVEGVKVAKIYYTTDVTHKKMKELLRNYTGIIVSKITAEALREQGYTKGIYITGRKFYKHNKFIGIKELSVL